MRGKRIYFTGCIVYSLVVKVWLIKVNDVKQLSIICFKIIPIADVINDLKKKKHSRVHMKNSHHFPNVLKHLFPAYGASIKTSMCL